MRIRVVQYGDAALRRAGRYRRDGDGYGDVHQRASGRLDDQLLAASAVSGLSQQQQEQCVSEAAAGSAGS